MATQYPESLREIVKKAVAAFPSDIDKAVDQVHGRFKKLPEYWEWIDALVRGEIRNLVHDGRHHTAVAIRRECGDYGGPAKVGLSDAVNRAAIQSVLDSYPIDGRALGDILGGELDDVAKRERERGNGHIRNAKLCTLLSQIVPKEKTVRQSVSDKQARKLIEQAGNGRKTKAA